MQLSRHSFALAVTTALYFMLGSFTALAEIEIATKGSGERAVAKQISAEITAIDNENRILVLQGPLGNQVSMQVGDAVERFDEFAVGDLVQATFLESIAGELREPTEEELLVPWAELDAAALAGESIDPGAAVGKVIRAVCTIEGMNRITRTVTVLDPMGQVHVIGDIDPARMEGVTLGQTIILTYTRAMALELEKL